jgi:hypothetical protein
MFQSSESGYSVLLAPFLGYCFYSDLVGENAICSGGLIYPWETYYIPPSRSITMLIS